MKTLFALVLSFSVVSAQAAINISTDQLGRLTSVGTSQSRTFNEYDAAGRVVASQHVLQGHASVFRSQFGYPQSASAIGLGTVITGQTFPDGETVAYAYDAAEQQVSVRSTFQGVTDDVVRDVRFNARGQVIRTELGNGTATTLQYDDNGTLFLSRITTVNAAGQTIQHYQYGYDNDANVTSTVDHLHPGDSFTLTYDELGQLTGMLDAAGTTVLERYQYDAVGNLTLKGMIEQSYGTGGAAGRPHALDRSGGQAYSYDENGNVTAIGTSTTLQWSAVNMPTRIAAGSVIAEKSYVDTELWRKAEQGVTTHYLPSMRLENAIGRKYYGGFAERGGLDLTPNGRQLRFYHPDHLGSSALVTDQGGAPIHVVSYTPWGQDRGVEGPFQPKLQFNFKEKDATGFYDYGARLYNPVTGRWLSPDPLLRDGLNRYAYVRNNPWTKVDPTGLSSEDAGSMMGDLLDIDDEDPAKGPRGRKPARRRKEQSQPQQPAGNGQVLFVDENSTEYKQCVSDEYESGLEKAMGGTFSVEADANLESRQRTFYGASAAGIVSGNPKAAAGATIGGRFAAWGMLRDFEATWIAKKIQWKHDNPEKNRDLSANAHFSCLVKVGKTMEQIQQDRFIRNLNNRPARFGFTPPR
ncbi:MAG TPA: RHS repeat-associated core domain-containing protein [Thermoanaerobaculia bacterium]|nr:RHS repeat-associated core domain-containing protein [Thermoanaerobaculia bacterium]